MFVPRLLVAALVALPLYGARADEPAPPAAAPPPPAPGPTAPASPLPPAPSGPPGTLPDANVRLVAPARWTAGSWLLNAHLSAGVEPHAFTCDAHSAGCQPAALGVGGSVLWRGLIGLGLGLYSSLGSPLVASQSGTAGQPAQLSMGDRISTVAALAVRPFAYGAWSGRESFLARSLGLEIGPSVEYVRTSSATLAGCDIPATAIKPGLHAQVSLEVPLLGGDRGGMLALRFAARFVVSDDVLLAPTKDPNDTACRPQVRQPGQATQLLAGVSYYL